MGQLSRSDMESEIKKGGLKIVPFSETCQKAASYDITPSIIAMSVKIGMLEKVYREPHYNKDKYYILVHPKDTVLIVSNEYLIVPSDIAGYISSRVSKLVDGFGHISTTIDPNWRGAVLIALSNPSNQPLKVYVGSTRDATGKPNQLATVSFHYLETSCATTDIDGVPRGMRLDMLEKVLYKNKRGFKAFWRNIFLVKRKKFTDYFMSICTEKYKTISVDDWSEIVKEFSYLDYDDETSTENPKHISKMAKLKANDFIITENLFTRVRYWLQNKHDLIFKLFACIVIILIGLGIIPENFLELLLDLLFK